MQKAAYRIITVNLTLTQRKEQEICSVKNMFGIINFRKDNAFGINAFGINAFGINAFGRIMRSEG